MCVADRNTLKELHVTLSQLEIKRVRVGAIVGTLRVKPRTIKIFFKLYSFNLI